MKQWYVAYTKRRQELKIKAYLEEAGFECYLPREVRISCTKHGKARQETLAVNGLIFICTDEEGCRALRRDMSVKLYFIVDRETNFPVPIPRKQMRDFMFLMAHPAYIGGLYGPDIRRGDRVTVTEGPLKGAEGEFLRIGGDRRVVIRVENVFSIATVFVHPQFLRRLY